MTAGYSPDASRYWASVDDDKIAAEVRRRFESYQAELRASGRVAVWQVADTCYHGRNSDGGYSNSQVITFGGEEGELAKIHVGHFRRHVNGQISMATADRPAIEVTQSTNDAEATAACQIARQVLEYDLDGDELEGELIAAHVRAVLYAEGYLVQSWDFHAGDVIGTSEIDGELVDDGAPGLPDRDSAASEGEDEAPSYPVPVYAGEVRTIVRSPIDVARDLDLDTTDDAAWYVVRTRQNRWDLAARFPESSEKRKVILDAPDADSDGERLWPQRSSSSGTGSDYVAVLTLYHVPTPALPEGRLVEVVGEDALSVQPYPYDHMVVHRDIPSAEVDRCLGYSDAWDLLALSQALDSVESSLLTVHDAGSLINWVSPRGAKVDPVMLSTGLRLIEYDHAEGMQPPRVMERPEVRSSDFEVSKHYLSHMQTLSGQNAVVQGDPSANIKAGNFAALVASMAVRAVSSQVQSYGALFRSVMTGRLKLYQLFAREERLIEVAGKDATGHVQSFTADKLKGARRVKVELANPLLRTLHGKLEVASKLLEAYGPEAIPLHRFFALMQTGRLDDLDPGAVEKHRVIARRENDSLRSGEAELVQVLVSDNHETHISEHLDQMNDASVRMDPNAAQRLAQLAKHVTEHVMMWEQASPAMLAATGQMPAPMAAPPMPPGGGGGPPGAEPMIPPPGGPGPMPGQGAGGAPGMPDMPLPPGGANPLPGGGPMGPGMMS